VKKEGLATRQPLQEEFAAELATIRGRIDASACSGHYADLSKHYRRYSN